MRKLSPVFIVTSVTLAIASSGAFAQVAGSSTAPRATGANAASGTTASTTAGTSTTTTSTNTVSTGGCVGTGGSTCSATTTSTSPATTSTSPTTTSTFDARNPDVTVTAPAPASGTTSSSSSGSGLAIAGTTESSSADTTGGVANTGMGTGVIVPGVVTTMDPSLNANGERIVAAPAAPTASANASMATAPTPIFDLTARQGLAKEARRRARGEEPRVYGIAPRTERDLTHQMPDDPIIRY